MKAIQSFERIGPEECRRLLATRAFGRICFNSGDRVEVVLTAYVLLAEAAYVRVSAFGAVGRKTDDGPLTLEVDNMSADRQADWSVTCVATAHRVVDAVTLAALWTPTRPDAWSGGATGMWVVLDGLDIEGQKRVA